MKLWEAKCDSELDRLAQRVAKLEEKLFGAMERIATLEAEDVHLRDEMGHKENGQKFWTWCFRAELYTLFRIDKSRGSQLLVEGLGEEFNGVLGCDSFSAYRKYIRECDC